jgi:hypothetical protein
VQRVNRTLQRAATFVKDQRIHAMTSSAQLVTKLH